MRQYERVPIPFDFIIAFPAVLFVLLEWIVKCEVSDHIAAVLWGVVQSTKKDYHGYK